MDADKLAKVLALAESDHQGEALSALRAARIILARDGMSFRDLAASLRSDPPPRPRDERPPTPPDRPPSNEAQLLGLRRQVAELEEANGKLNRRVERLRGEAVRLRDEVEHWRGLARETAEQLWDLGKALERRHSRGDRAALRRAIIESLQDPESGVLSDRELARRLGTSPRLVAGTRRRLAIVGRKLRLLPVEPRGRGLWTGGHGRLTIDQPRRRWEGFLAVVTIGGRSGQIAKR